MANIDREDVSYMKHASNHARLYQLKVSLDHIAPAIWRRLLVPSNITLRRLHDVIQKAMGWTNSHLYWFQLDGRQFGRPDPESEFYVEDDARYRLGTMLIVPGHSMAYEYDMGDSWRHTILLEEILLSDEQNSDARCVAGARACPPEDCGGVPGYQSFLEAILDPFNPRHREMLAWVGHRFDPEAFDIDAVNRLLAHRRSAQPVRNH